MIRVEMDEPILVAQGPPDERRWGFWQFPTIGRTPDGTLVVQFNIAEDKIRTATDGDHGIRVSHDEGRTWQQASDDSLRHWAKAVRLANGDWINVTRAVRSFTPGSLPEPLTQYPSSRRTQSHRYWHRNKVPRELQPIYVWRRPAGATQWRREDCWIGLDNLAVSGPVNTDVVTAGFHPEGNLHITRDGRLLLAGYGTLIDGQGRPEPLPSSAIMESFDGGVHWSPVKVFHGNDVPDLGFDEAALNETDDCTLVWISRTALPANRKGSVGPMMWTRSNDGGKTWQRLAELDSFGVLPQLLRLGNGTMVVSYGRPGVHLKVSIDGARTWSERTEVLPAPREEGPPNRNSCSYTKLLPITDDSFFIVYSQFDWPSEDGKPAKSILVRKVRCVRTA